MSAKETERKGSGGAGAFVSDVKESRGGVFARHGRTDHTRRERAAPASGVPSVAAVDVLGRVDELADGTGGSVDAVTGAAIGPYRESQFNGPHQREFRALYQERR